VEVRNVARWSEAALDIPVHWTAELSSKADFPPSSLQLHVRAPRVCASVPARCVVIVGVIAGAAHRSRAELSQPEVPPLVRTE